MTDQSSFKLFQHYKYNKFIEEKIEGKMIVWPVILQRTLSRNFDVGHSGHSLWDTWDTLRGTLGTLCNNTWDTLCTYLGHY